MISHKANLIASILLSLVAIGMLFFWFPEGVIVGGAGFFFYGLFFAIFLILLELIRAIRKRPLLGISLLISIVINFIVAKFSTKECDGCFEYSVAGFPWPMYATDYGSNTSLYFPFIFNIAFWTVVIFFISTFIISRLQKNNR